MMALMHSAEAEKLYCLISCVEVILIKKMDGSAFSVLNISHARSIILDLIIAILYLIAVVKEG